MATAALAALVHWASRSMRLERPAAGRVAGLAGVVRLPQVGNIELDHAQHGFGHTFCTDSVGIFHHLCERRLLRFDDQRLSLSRMKSRTRGMICSRHLRPLKMP